MPYNNPFPASYPAYPYGMYGGYAPTGYYPPQPQPQPAATQAQPVSQPQQTGKTYYPPNWLKSEAELDEYSVQQGEPLFAFIHDASGNDRLVIRKIGDDGLPHDETIPLEFPKEEKLTHKDLEGYVRAEDFTAVVRELRQMRTRLDELQASAEPQPRRTRKAAPQTWEEDEDGTV